uniref:SphJ n=1 Tax=Herpetosiphon sp. B060 TaxID=2002978 RepID=A0A2Z2H058_9CHLR|nr:SphJ [Herpetosiphon sp. B060]
MASLIKALAPDPQLPQLFLFPFAGGTANSYRGLANALKSHFSVYAIDPQGHINRQEPLLDDLETMVEAYLAALLPLIKPDFTLFGHSLGGAVVYRLTQRLEQLGHAPVTVFISGYHPPHISDKSTAYLNDDQFLEHIEAMGGVPPEIGQDQSFMRYFLPIFRADFRATETFIHSDRTKIKAPVFVLNGDKDDDAIKHMQEWSYWLNQVRYRIFSGPHMYLSSQPELIATYIIECNQAISIVDE